MSIAELVLWGKSNGAIIDPRVSFEKGADGIGARYNGSNSEKAEIPGSLISVPLSICITPKIAVESLGNYGKALYEKSTNINSAVKIFLCTERASVNRSFFKPYIELLPALQEVGSPYTWSPEDKAMLKGTNLGNSLSENMSQLVEEWWQCISLLPKEVEKDGLPSLTQDHFLNMKFYYEYKFYTDQDIYEYLKATDVANWTSFGNYLWSSLILKSRSFPYYLFKESIDAEIKQDEAMLLPLIDLLNHSTSAKVNWSTSNTNGQAFFNFQSESTESGAELFNNYGMKGNEELLLAYGFCLKDNVADSAALKIKVPLEILPDLEAQGIKLPQINDYTTSIVRKAPVTEDSNAVNDYSKYSDGLLFFITSDNIPENLIELFQWLCRNTLEKTRTNTVTLRMKLAGLNQLRQAIESKNELIKLPSEGISTSPNGENIKLYLTSQKKIFTSSIKKIKNLEKGLLTDPELKPRLLTLKSIYKKDVKLQQALLVSLGISSYNDILESEFQDQFWLLYLMRCYNKNEYDDEDPEEKYLPEWIHRMFTELMNETEIKPAEVVQFKEIYLGLIPPLATAVPEVFARGQWRVNEMIISAKLLDLISFVRGKEQECILVECDYN
ncbi:protein-lysine N-methyltransferase Efm1p [[Candida] railenensis]|uniref:Protein-lysine N-methyltransferase Efm1p n=1 Tax=[Candida] railenensis TaxID=45579 RepID=A0A9P0VW60_9ASCO|nr:protein-lysine N-methyltransferase Efm1p [[Candida] railenensis]